MVGWVFDTADTTDVPADKLKAVLGVVPSVPRADATWLQLMRFMARYYQRGLGEVSLPALPKKLRQPAHFRQDEAGVWQLQQGKRTWQQWCKRAALDADLPAPIAFHAPLQLNTEQQSALNALLRTTQTQPNHPRHNCCSASLVAAKPRCTVCITWRRFCRPTTARRY